MKKVDILNKRFQPITQKKLAVSQLISGLDTLVRLWCPHFALFHFLFELFVESFLVLLPLYLLVVNLVVGVVHYFLLLDPRLERGHLVEGRLVSESLLLVEPLDGENFLSHL